MDLEKLKATDGTGPAVLANITANRAIAATTIVVDSVDNWPNEFIVCTGTLDANGYITAASLCEMIGHLDGGNIEIDSFVPGYTDAGNTEGQVAVIKPTGHGQTSLADLLQVAHDDDGSLKAGAVDVPEVLADNVVEADAVAQNAITGPKLATDAIKLGDTTKTTAFGPTATSTSDVDVTGLTITVTVPAGGRSLKITAFGGAYAQSGGIGTVYGVIKIKEGATVLANASVVPSVANFPFGWTVVAQVDAPTAGSHTYKVAVANNTTGPNFTLDASATGPMLLLVELI